MHNAVVTKTAQANGHVPIGQPAGATQNAEKAAAMEQLDVVVIGAGVVGLAVARALALTGREVWVLEKEAAVGTGVSARNSEVIHAGLYYTPGSLKAQCCVRGKELLYAYCASRHVMAHACGKLVVATDVAQLLALDALAAKARANGVALERLSAAQVQAMEPELQCLAAVYSPSTGIVDSHGLMQALQADLEHSGGVVALGSRVVAGEVRPEGIWLRVRSDGAPDTELLARSVVNAASLHATEVARAIHGSGSAAAFIPTTHFAKGSYAVLQGRAPFGRLVYPAPQGAWLGVHLTLDAGGQARFGPDLEWLAQDDPDHIDYRVDPARLQGFYAEVRRYWPGLPDGALVPGYSGVRPKIYGPGEAAPDFRIDGPAVHGVRGLVHLFGIESPGLTSALALAEKVCSELMD